MTPVPLTVIGGYLGAGKTTLINRVLEADHGLKLAVLVNDFGAINIDAALLASASEDTIELTNGCVCCTMSGDLFFAIGDLLDRSLRPDHILIEASGIADPAKIAAVSVAEKDLRYAGIVSVVDGLNIARHRADPRIAEQVEAQLDAADLLVVAKASIPETGGLPERAALLPRAEVSDLGAVLALIFGRTDLDYKEAHDGVAHPGYVHWSENVPPALSKEDILARLASAPSGVLRLKGVFPNPLGGYWELHLVGEQRDLRPRAEVHSCGLVAIGLKEGLSSDDLRRWWMEG